MHSSKSPIIKTKKNQKSLRVAVMLPFTTLLLLTVFILGIVQTTSYERMLSNVSTQLLTANFIGISKNLDFYLEQPFIITNTIADSIERNNLYPEPSLTKVEDYLKNIINSVYKSQTQINAMAFGTETDKIVGVKKKPDGGLSLFLKTTDTNDKLAIYSGDSTSSKLEIEYPNYSPKTRPWYVPFAKSQQAGWSDIYSNADQKQKLTISSVAPVYSDSVFQGLMVTDVNLDDISNFLAKEASKFSGVAFIIDAQGQLVANSVDSPIVNSKNRRIQATDSPTSIIALNSLFYENLHVHTEEDGLAFQITDNDERYFTRIAAYNNKNIHWHIVVSYPEKALVGSLSEQQSMGLFAVLVVSLFGLLMALYSINQATKPIIDIARASQDIDENNWDVTVKDNMKLHETTQLVSAFTSMSSRLKISFSSLREQLLLDHLTGLFTRKGLINYIDENQITQRGTLVLIGLKSFRQTIGSLGYQHSEHLLVTIAQRLQNSLVPDSLIARVEKDEFAVFVPHISTDTEALHYAKELLAYFDQPFAIDNMEVIVMANAGVISGERSQQDISEWLRNAGLALSQALVQEDTPICHYQDHMMDASQEHTRLMTELKRALGTSEFEVFYQPVVELATNTVSGAEALIRWRSPTRGLVPPLDFIPLAEDTGMIVDIGAQILRQACFETQQQIALGHWQPSFALHVNLSVRELLQPDYAKNVKQILKDSGLPAKNLSLEITESRLVSQPHLTNVVLKELQEMGIKIAIDDFGTGYSSLSYLPNLPFDTVKIDRSFVSKMLSNDKYAKMVATIIHMTHAYSAHNVAEGVESAEEAEQLKSYGCKYAQGYYYAKPLPLSQWHQVKLPLAENSSL